MTVRITPGAAGTPGRRRGLPGFLQRWHKTDPVPPMTGVIVLCLISACTSPVESLRSVSSDVPLRTIFVSLDTWHAMIAFPADEPNRSSAPLMYEEWGYAERAWYIEGRQGLGGIVRALFWPSEGVVEVGRYDQVWADRTPQPPAELFVFRVDDAAYRRLRRHLHNTLSNETPITSIGQSVFYPSARSYHLFHTCHHYAAYALREAGLPISPLWSFNRTTLAWQLRYAARLRDGPSTGVPAGELH